MYAWKFFLFKTCVSSLYRNLNIFINAFKDKNVLKYVLIEFNDFTILLTPLVSCVIYSVHALLFLFGKKPPLY